MNNISVVNDENEDYLINPGERVLLNLSVKNQGVFAHPGLTSSLYFIGPIDGYENTHQKLDESIGGIYGTEYGRNMTGISIGNSEYIVKYFCK